MHNLSLLYCARSLHRACVRTCARAAHMQGLAPRPHACPRTALPRAFFAATREMSLSCSGSDLPEALVVAYITVPNMEVGKKLAHHLVASKLAACVNIMPKVVSVFEWEGKTEEDTEELLMVKTRQAHLEAIAKVLKDKEYHPYDCAELIALPIVAGAKDYMQWAIDQTAPAS